MNDYDEAPASWVGAVNVVYSIHVPTPNFLVLTLFFVLFDFKDSSVSDTWQTIACYLQSVCD